MDNLARTKYAIFSAQMMIASKQVAAEQHRSRCENPTTFSWYKHKRIAALGVFTRNKKPTLIQIAIICDHLFVEIALLIDL